MCGIAGIFCLNGQMHHEELVSTIQLMSEQIKERGPDDFGVWVDSSNGLGLGHRRLSIVDLSASGHQPMHSKDGRYVMVFNGEIYNHLEIRSEFHLSKWAGHSDTETLLESFQILGIEEALKKSIGMFAVAVWDTKDKKLILARDRLGEKPLYYGWVKRSQGYSFVFGSELKAVRVTPQFEPKVNRAALSLYLQYGYIPSPYSIYEEIYKLNPGCYLEISLDEPEPKITQYWSIQNAILKGRQKPFLGDKDQAANELESLLKKVIKNQMLADVPVGAFLSGGIDSSTIVSLMQSQSNIPIKTFTIGFKEASFNEAKYAKAVSEHLGTEHVELYVTPKQALEIIPHLSKIYCEPFADSSQIPTYLVSKLAVEDVKVCLSGDGGDELFCGYSRYIFAQKIWKYLSRVPLWLREMIQAVIYSISIKTWSALFRRIKWAIPEKYHYKNFGERIHKGAGTLNVGCHEELYKKLVSYWERPSEVLLGSYEGSTESAATSQAFGMLDPLDRMMAIDTITYLPDDILVKVDRAAMANSLEGRIPFLDHRVVEFAWSLPIEFKLRGTQSKAILRDILKRFIPTSLIDRPKMGFGVPIDSWLRGPLRGWAETLLDEDRLRHEGYFAPNIIRQKWSEHLSGERNWQNQLWAILMFQAWLEHEK